MPSSPQRAPIDPCAHPGPPGRPDRPRDGRRDPRSAVAATGRGASRGRVRLRPRSTPVAWRSAGRAREPAAATRWRCGRSTWSPTARSAPASAAWQGSRPDDAALLARIADQPQGLWLGEWRRDVRGTAAARVRAGLATGATPILVAYNIPHRDCGQHSSGGASDGRAYRAWIAQLGAGHRRPPRRSSMLEPDALRGHGLPAAPRSRDERSDLIADAVARLAALPADRGLHRRGQPGLDPGPAIARRLRAPASAGRAASRSTSPASPPPSAPSRSARAVSAPDRRRPLRGRHQPQRRSAPADSGEWCNPPGRALGPPPTTDTGEPLVDGLPVDQAAGRVGRRLQRRAARRGLLAGVRAGPREARARGLTQASNPARGGR